MRKNIALVATLAIAVGLSWWGVYILLNPPVMAFGRMHQKPLVPYLGQLLLAASCIIAWFHHAVANGLTWFASKIHHWILLLVALMLHPLIHLMGVPHQEEWFLALLGGGISFSAFQQQLLLWCHQLRQRFKRK